MSWRDKAAGDMWVTCGDEGEVTVRVPLTGRKKLGKNEIDSKVGVEFKMLGLRSCMRHLAKENFNQAVVPGYYGSHGIYKKIYEFLHDKISHFITNRSKFDM